MHTLKKKTATCFGAIVLVLVLLVMSTAFAGGGVYTMRGEISAISLRDKIVVVEIPVPQDSITVGGPLAPNAKVTKGNRPASLGEFKVGETVTVRWRLTKETHVIEMLAE